MKVILLQDIANMGKRYEVKDIPAGYARNFLFPRSLAQFADSKIIKEANKKRAAADALNEKKEADLIDSLTKVTKKPITISRSANEKGSLFAGIHVEDISALIKEHTKVDFDTSYISLASPIKETGEHTITLTVGKKKANLMLVVNAEE